MIFDTHAHVLSPPVLDFWTAASSLRLPVTVILYTLGDCAHRFHCS